MIQPWASDTPSKYLKEIFLVRTYSRVLTPILCSMSSEERDRYFIIWWTLLFSAGTIFSITVLIYSETRVFSMNSSLAYWTPSSRTASIPSSLSTLALCLKISLFLAERVVRVTFIFFDISLSFLTTILTKSRIFCPRLENAAIYLSKNS